MKNMSIVPDFLVIDLEGFRHRGQPIIVKDFPVRGHDYSDTILFQALHKFSCFVNENKKNLLLAHKNPALQHVGSWYTQILSCIACIEKAGAKYTNCKETYPKA